MIKAYSKHTGGLLWQAKLPAAGFATPITDAEDGQQFLMSAGQASGSHYIAFALPASVSL